MGDATMDVQQTRGPKMQLTHYDNAKRELAEAHRVDEVKSIHDKAAAMSRYAVMAKDHELSRYATEIRLRAERRLGEVMKEMPKAKAGNPNFSIGSTKDPIEKVPTLASQGIDKHLADRARKAAAMPATQYEKKIVRQTALAEKAASIVAKPADPRSEHSNIYEWYTPAKYIEAAKAVLGGIDLDPASCAKAQKVVRADNFFSEEDDGLKQEWGGTVWLNPPYKTPLIANFIDKLVSERQSGRVTSAILLTNNATDTGWFHAAMAACSAVCFTRGRISFYNEEGESRMPTCGQAFFYFGDHVARFAEVFKEIGSIVEPRRSIANLRSVDTADAELQPVE